MTDTAHGRPFAPLGAALGAALADRYRIERELGAGGMATVYLAADLKHDRKVAIKVLKPELAAVLGAERFVQEIKTTAALQHPHILPLFDSGEADGFLYYVMPYIEGETIREKLNRETQAGVDEAVRIAREVADALDYAHRHGVIHRDIKPENILLHDGRAMVMDFGIALAVSAAAGGRMTETGLSLGTPYYMSPEQATADRDITARSDVYSRASVLYEMLAGDPPFTASSAQAVIMKIITEQAAPVTARRKAVPPNISAAIAKALEKLPADRFENAKAFADALANPGFTLIGGAGGIGGVSQHTRRGRRTQVVIAAGLLLLSTGIWVWMRPTAAGEAGRPWQVRIILPDSAPIAEGLTLSPDGSVLIYDSHGRLWKRTADAPDPTLIAETERSAYPTISPDGRHLAFWRSASSGPSGLVTMTLDGGGLKTVVANPPIGTPFGWADNDHIVYSGLTGLMRAPVSGGDARQITTVDTAAHEVLHLSANGLAGRGVVFTIASRAADSAYIGVVGPGGGKVKRLFPGLFAVFSPTGHLIVTREDGSIVAVPFDASHLRVTGAPMPIASGLSTGGFSIMGHAAVSASGRLIYVSRGWGEYNDPTDVVWVNRAGLRTSEDPGKVLLVSLALSPDGRRVATGHAGDRSEDLRVRDLATGATMTVSIPGALLRDPVFSPDGRQLYFIGLGASPGLHRVEVGGTAPPERIFTSDFAGIAQPTISRTADVVYFTNFKDRRIVRYSLADKTTATAVAWPAGSSYSRPQLSPDGRWIAFLASESNGTRVRARSTDSARSEEWAAGAADPQTSLRWSRSGTELLYVHNDSMIAVPVITTPAFAFGKPHALFSTAGLTPVFDVGPDARFLMIRPRPDTRPPTELTMLERWTAMLSR
ncbi:MAG TPA: protein kinase [Gemmatimonadaceae bacterium]